MLAIIKYHIFCNADSDIPNKSLKYNIQKKQDKHQIVMYLQFSNLHILGVDENWGKKGKGGGNKTLYFSLQNQ